VSNPEQICDSLHLAWRTPMAHPPAQPNTPL
jgi:hypothetical protein